MIRGEASQGVEAGVGEHAIPKEVHKATIELDQSGINSLIAPRKSTFEERDLYEFETVDRVIEHAGFADIKRV
jgi:hypothetical protein